MRTLAYLKTSRRLQLAKVLSLCPGKASGFSPSGLTWIHASWLTSWVGEVTTS